MNKLKKWYSENKDKPLFKAKLLLVVLIILAIGVQIYANYRDEKEFQNTETSVTETAAEEADEQDALLTFWNNSKAHVVAFLGVTAALAVVKQRQKQKIKESG